jgi:PTH1 family peptidyl-tRNA hydrolase
VRPEEYLVIGLGNPGRAYLATRHNIGQVFVDWLNYRPDCEQIPTLKPDCYMNLSGETIQKHLDYYKIPVSQIVVAHDDVDLPFGEVRLKTRGRDGGHKGVRSIIKFLETKNFYRIRFGIGRPDNPDFPLEKFVLAKFKCEEIEHFSTMFQEAKEILFSLPDPELETHHDIDPINRTV